MLADAKWSEDERARRMQLHTQQQQLENQIQIKTEDNPDFLK
jgi:hypothetical protein